MNVLKTTAALALTLVAATSYAAPVVVLDPGHGGTNRGAFGPWIKRYEKRMTLTLARRTANYLRLGLPGIQVVLTRDRDEYLTLAQRVRRANHAKADLFVSIHLNACESHALYGYETYILTRQAAELEAGRLRMRSRVLNTNKENEGVVQRVLSDLKQSAAHGQSALLARRVQRALERVRGSELNRGVRQAAFDVLLGLRMPGVLVEAGFIDHPEESQQLARPAVQEAIGAALAAGVIEQLRAAGTAVDRAKLSMR
jgi:N-acetylmuramoyl-L-alanine amidase